MYKAAIPQCIQTDLARPDTILPQNTIWLSILLCCTTSFSVTRGETTKLKYISVKLSIWISMLCDIVWLFRDFNRGASRWNHTGFYFTHWLWFSRAPYILLQISLCGRCKNWWSRSSISRVCEVFELRMTYEERKGHSEIFTQQFPTFKVHQATSPLSS